MLALYRTLAVLDRNQAEELAPTGLNAGQFNLLNVLYRAKTDLNMRQLAEMMALQPTNLSGIVRTLRAKGFLQQTIDEADRRSLLVSITPAGQRFLNKVLPPHWARIEAIMAGLDEGKRDELNCLLEQLIASIRAAEVNEQRA